MSKRDMLFGTMDIIYTKVKPPNLRKLEYKHWLESLVLMATHNRTTMGDVVGAVLEAAAPAVNSRVEHAEEFHFAMDEKKEAAESVFYPLDPMNKGCIPHADVMHALSDLGVMDGIHSRIAGDTVAAVFTSVDPMRKGTVTLREFKQFMEKLLHLRANPFNTVSSLGDAKSSLGDAKSSLGDAYISLGDAKSSLGDAYISLDDAKSSLGDAKSSLGEARTTTEVAG